MGRSQKVGKHTPSTSVMEAASEARPKTAAKGRLMMLSRAKKTVAKTILKELKPGDCHERRGSTSQAHQ